MKIKSKYVGVSWEKDRQKWKAQIDIRNNNYQTFNISSVKASILNIEVVKNYANIKVRFLSTQKVTLNNKIKKLENIKDIWTFEKDMKADSLIWKLVEVGTD